MHWHHPHVHVARGAAALAAAMGIGRVRTLALAAGRGLGSPSAVALLTAGYSVGQMVGPLVVTPLVHNGFRDALVTSAGIVSAAAAAAVWLLTGLRRDADRPRAATHPGRRAGSGRPPW